VIRKHSSSAGWSEESIEITTSEQRELVLNP